MFGLEFRSTSVKTFMTKRETYHHGDLRQALIEAALKLVSEKDVDSVSLREVARQVGVSHTAPYRHFADKDSLLAAVAQEGFQMLHHALDVVPDETSLNPLKRLQEIGVTYVDFALKHSTHYRLMFSAYGATSAQQNPELEQAAKQAFMVLVNGVKSGQQQGLIRPDNAQQLALAAWALTHGLAMLLMDGQIPMEDSQAVAPLSGFITQVLVEGLAT
jgi:AcrR family transcriptional regulator